MVEQEHVFIDPGRVDEYKSLVHKRFRQWHEEEWFFVSYDEFLEISRASLLANIKYLLDHTSEEGIVDLNGAEEFSKETAGEYFSDERFNKAVGFITGNRWDSLERQITINFNTSS